MKVHRPRKRDRNIANVSRLQVAGCGSRDLAEIVRAEFLLLAAANKQHSFRFDTGRTIQHRQLESFTGQLAGCDELLCCLLKGFFRAEYGGLRFILLTFLNDRNHQTIGLNIGSVLDGQIKFHYFVFLQS